MSSSKVTLDMCLSEILRFMFLCVRCSAVLYGLHFERKYVGFNIGGRLFRLSGINLRFCPPLRISVNMSWLAFEFCTDIHVPKRMNTTGLGGPLTYPQAPPCG